MQKNNQAFRKEFRCILHSGDVMAFAGMRFNNGET